MTPLVILSCLLSLLPVIGAQSTFSPARPPALPLAVKSPYLSTWLNAGRDGGNGGYLPGQWPTFWGGQINAWTGLIRVDGKPYTWMGAPPNVPLANQTAYEYTTTKSVFTINVDDLVQITATFLSPITPDDFKRQSLIFSYLDVAVKSLDGNEHAVQLYTDITAEWISGNRANIAQWNYGTTGNVAYHQVYRQTQQAFSEVADQTEYGNWYWATHTGNGFSYQAGPDTVVRGQFESNGVLANSHDSNFRAIQNNWPVFAFTFDLGTVGTSDVSRLFSIGLCQQEAIQFDGATGVKSLPSLWTSYFQDDLAAVEFFQNDYPAASQMSGQLDDKVNSDSVAAAGQDYATLTTLSVRQAFGAVQLVGTTSDEYVFMKEISSDGNVNTVDVVFPAHPAFIYTNPQFLSLLLKPLFENQESGQYPNQWSMHDLGSHFPNATGHPDGADEQMPLEECGNMIIMTLAYYMASKDLTFLKEHYTILKQWTMFLVQESLYPANQISTDDFAGALANQTNLALKGMIGIKAMSVIADVTGNSADHSNYSSIATDYINQWLNLGIAHDANPPHTTLAYGSNNTWGILYNLYGDKVLNLGLVPQSVYDMQSAFYPTVNNQYGVPLDTRHTYTKGDWESWAAAIASSSTRDLFFKDLANWINTTPTNKAETDLYDTQTGDYPGITFIARPVMGGTLALLNIGLNLQV